MEAARPGNGSRRLPARARVPARRTPSPSVLHLQPQHEALRLPQRAVGRPTDPV